MTAANKKIINSYLKGVSANLNCTKSLKSVFLTELKSDIENYAKSTVSVTKDDLYNEFGTPEEISNSLFDRHDYDALLNKAKRKALACKLIAIVLIMLLVVAVYVIAEMWDLIHFEVTVTNVY